MLKTFLLAGLGLIGAPAIASAQTAGSPDPYAGGSSAIDGLGHGVGSVSLPEEPPQRRTKEPDQTRQRMSGRNCECQEKAPSSPAKNSGCDSKGKSADK